MSVHEIGEYRTAPDVKRWSILPLTMLAAQPTNAAVQIDYGRDHLLCSIEFRPRYRYSEAPARNWQPNGMIRFQVKIPDHPCSRART